MIDGCGLHHRAEIPEVVTVSLVEFFSEHQPQIERRIYQKNYQENEVKNQSTFTHPYDSPLSSGLRFLTEILGWVACTLAAYNQSVWLAIPALIILVGLPTVFSTPGDKKQVIVATPGPLRLILEIVLFVLFVVCAWAVWPTWMAIITTVVVVAAFVTGLPRAKWLLRGAPREPE